MTEFSFEQVAEVPDASTNAPEPAPVEVRLPRWQSFLIAVGSLVLVFGIGLGVTVAGGAVVHAFDPSRHVNSFAALHNAWVVGILLGITVLWLLPPYPWAKRVVASGSREQPADIAGGAGDGDEGLVTVRLETGPGAAPRPSEDRREVASSLRDS